MSTLPPHDSPAVYWIDAHLQQQGPESLATVIERLAYQQIPDTTPVWWPGAEGWTAFNANPTLVSLLDARMRPAEPAYTPTAEPTYTEPTYSPAAYTPAAEPAYTEPTYTEPTYAEPTYTADQSYVPDTGGSDVVTPAGPAYETPVASPFETAAQYTAPAPAAEQPFAPAAVQAATPDAGGYDSAQTAAAGLFESAPTAEQSATWSNGDTAWNPAPDAEATPAAVSEPTAHQRGLVLGDPATLTETFSQLQSRYSAHVAEAARSAKLDDTLADTVNVAVKDLGFEVDTHALTDTHHTFALAAPDGSPANLSIGRVPASPTLAAAIEQPLSITVEHDGSASTGLFLGDYLDASDGLDANLLARHVAAVVHAATTGGGQ